MNYATIKWCDIANGEGVRVSLFVSGCTHRCKNCFNEVAWDFSYGEHYTAELEQKILDALSPDYIKGFSLLGGEPFEPSNQAVLVELLERIKEKYPNKTVWCYSGYSFTDHILPCCLGNPEITKRMIRCIDVLVDGPFIAAERDAALLFRGSRNQRLIDVPATLKSGSVTHWRSAFALAA